VSADITCSIVDTDASPHEIVVLRAVLDTFSANASIVASSPMSVLLNMIPESAGAGLIVILADLPV
jgi:hypothetical protein